MAEKRKYTITGVAYDDEEVPGGVCDDIVVARKDAHVLLKQAGVYAVWITGEGVNECHDTHWQSICRGCPRERREP